MDALPKSGPHRALAITLGAALGALTAIMVPSALAGGVMTASLQPDLAGTASRTLSQDGIGLAPLPGETVFSALSITSWIEGDVKRLALEGWVTIEVGDLTVSGQRAAAWIIQRDGLNLEDPPYQEIAIYIEEVSAATRASGMSSEGDQLLVTAAIQGPVRLRCDDLNERLNQIDPEMLSRAEMRFLAHLRRSRPEDPPSITNVERFTPQQRPLILPDPAPGQAQSPQDQRSFAPVVGAAPEALVLFRADGRLEYHVAEDESEATVSLRDNLVIEYLELGVRPGEREPRHLSITADRAVVFVDPMSASSLQTQQLSASAVRGVYLEGQVVATDGTYTLRGPRMYYEFDTNRAIVLDGVFSTYSDEARVPIYMRAEEIRQVSVREWSADNVRVSTSEFYTPHLSVGASSATIERREHPTTGEDVDYVRVKDVTLRAGDLPFFWMPGYKGRVEDFPLRRISVGVSDRNGATIKSEWDLLGLMGWEHSSDIDASLLVDYFDERGPATGLDLTYQDENSRGRLFGYVIQDDGEDLLSSGAKRDVDDQTRGMLTWAHRERLSDDWTVIAELSHISDPNFVDSFYDGLSEERRDFMTRLYALQQRDNWALEIFANTDLNGFIANEDVLQAPGYIVEKVPEVGYYRFADDLFGDRLSYSSEYQLSRMRLSFPDHDLDEIGQGRAGFGMIPSTNLTTAALAQGYTEDYVGRFTTRQEVSAPRDVGIFRVVPFVTGRFTAYDDDFDTFNRASEEMWWWGGGGVRIATEFSRVDNSVDNRFLDLHRLRHIIEPQLTVWSASSDAGVGDYPIYDMDVEGISKGSLVRMGMRNTWQTQRGGEGRWRSVDVLVVNTDVVLHGSETQGDYSLPHYFDYRPEYSRLGDHFAGDARYLVSDYFALAGHMIYDLERSAVARSAVGFRIDHSQDLFTYSDLRYLDADDATFLSFGLGYALSPLYSVRGSVTFDLSRDESQRTNFELTRRTPQVDVIFGFSYDQYREDSTFSVSISPQGTGGKRYGGALNPRDEDR